MYCPQLVAPEHAYFVHGGDRCPPDNKNGDGSSGDGGGLAVPNEACGLRCRPGFQMPEEEGEGNALRLCLSSGRWSGRKPRWVDGG